MKKRIVALAVCLLTVISLFFIPEFFGIKASAADFTSWDEISVLSRVAYFYDNAYCYDCSFSDVSIPTQTTSRGYALRFFVNTPGEAVMNPVFFPVGDSLTNVMISFGLDIDLGSRTSISSVGISSSTNDLCFLVCVGCYNNSGSLIGYYKKRILTGTSPDGVYSISISGAELYSSTAYFTVMSGYGYFTASDFDDSSLTGFANYANASLYNCVLTSAFKITTSEGSWKSEKFDDLGLEEPSFYWSHENMYIRIYEGADVNMYFAVDGFGDVDMSVQVTLYDSDPSNDVHEMYYDTGQNVMWGAYQFNYQLSDSEQFFVTAAILINGIPVYTFSQSAWVLPGSDLPDGSGGSGGSDNTEVMDLLEQVDANVSEVMDAFQETSDKIDTLTEEVEQLPAEIVGGMEQIQEQEKEQASAEGDAGAQEVIEIIPNPSADFLPALENLASVMKYDGTAAVLSLPAVSIPEIAGVIPEIHLMDEQEVNFESFMYLVPDAALTLVRALFDAALVLFCLRELIELIGAALTGFKSVKPDQ